MRGKKIPQADRARAVGIAAVTSIAEASRQTGISESAIRAWYDRPEYAELRDRTTEVATSEWWAGVQLAFRRSVELLDKTDDPVKAATAGAIMFDKMALSRGEATSRSETRTWTDALDPDKQRRLRDWALSRLDELDGREGVPDPTPAGTGDSEPPTG